MKKFLKRYYGRYKKQIFFITLSLVLIGLGLAIFFHQLEARNIAAITSPTPSAPSYLKVEKFRVPVLMYHYIREAPDDLAGQRLSVSPKTLDSEASWLKDNGYQSIVVSDLSDPQRRAISQIYAEGKKPVVLTFDDGYADAYINAFPILKKYQFVGSFYIIRNNVGKSRYLSQTQIDEMVSAGMEIGSHSLSHPDLGRASLAEASRQIFDSKQNATSFCYPSGQFNPTIEALVGEAGYLNATTTKFGIVDENSNLFELPRVRMSEMDLAKFRLRLEGRDE